MNKPRLRYAKLPTQGGQFRTLIQLDFSPPKQAVAIVLDLSDSHVSIRDTARHLPHLLGRVPRDIPLFIYRLSSRQAVNFGNADTTSHLIDGSLSVLK